MRNRAQPRSVLDWIGIAATGALLIFFAATGLYGAMTAFTPTLTYEGANLWVGLVCAGLSALCGLYLCLELDSDRLRLGASIVVAAFAGYYATIGGIPALAAQWDGNQGLVPFTVVEIGLGSRTCGYNFVGHNPDYAQLRLCGDGISPRLKVGDRVLVHGHVSDWGTTVNDVTVAPGTGP